MNAELVLELAVFCNAQKPVATENQGRHFPNVPQPLKSLVITLCWLLHTLEKRQSRDFYKILRETHRGEGRRKRKKKKTSNSCSQLQNK